ncbi:MAG TPA: hypothetical protein VND89_10210 [Acidimicrobiales bacterium]|nr:hypothetical protein [Acidimicrobiales bacterium]
MLTYSDALTLNSGRVDDAVITVLKEHLSDEHILDLTYITTLYVMHATMSNALRLENDDVPDGIVGIATPEVSQTRDIGVDVSLP